MNSSFQNKRYLIVGATSSIGMLLSEMLLRDGAKVFAVARQVEKLEHLSKRFPDSFKSIRKDLMSEGVGLELIQELDETGLDGFLYAAGTLKIAPLKFFKPSDFQAIMRVNCEAFLEICQALTRKSRLLPHSSIVAISSVLEKHAVMGNGIYAASKAALSAACRVLALELSREGIRVNTVASGALTSGMTAQVSGALSQEVADKHNLLYPLGSGQPEDVANLIMFLLSPSSRWITATTSVIDGGFSSL